jgi:hypothetical protein
VHPAGAGFLFDILKTAIDDRVEGIDLALDFSVRHAAAASRRSAAPPVARVAPSLAIARAPIALPAIPLIRCPLIPAARAIGALIAIASAGGPLGRCGAAAFDRGRRPGSRGGRASAPAVTGAGRPGSERARGKLARRLPRRRFGGRCFAAFAWRTLRNWVTRTAAPPARPQRPAVAWRSCGGGICYRCSGSVLGLGRAASSLAQARRRPHGAMAAAPIAQSQGMPLRSAFRGCFRLRCAGFGRGALAGIFGGNPGGNFGS